MITTAGIFILLVFLATFVEWISERFFAPFTKLKGWPMVLITSAIGIALCFGFKVDAMALVGFTGEYASWLGYAITGIIIGSGSNALHKFFAPSKKHV